VDDHQKRIGRRIAQARRDKGWSQRELGDALGISEGQISRYETGRVTPHRARYEAIANALDVLAEIFFYDPPGRAE
jgi:transcriptional regulator with XRE-family HTH domain